MSEEFELLKAAVMKASTPVLTEEQLLRQFLTSILNARGRPELNDPFTVKLAREPVIRDLQRLKAKGLRWCPDPKVALLIERLKQQ